MGWTTGMALMAAPYGFKDALVGAECEEGGTESCGGGMEYGFGVADPLENPLGGVWRSKSLL